MAPIWALETAMLRYLIILLYFSMSFSGFSMDDRKSLEENKRVDNIMAIKLNDEAKNQISQCINLLKEVFGQNLLGVYLYGSSIIGGLQKYSDIDIFVVLQRSIISEEKTILKTKLLTLSGIYMKSSTRPIEMTIVVKSEVNPWHYPPHFDWQYGEWLRDQFTKGNIEPWPTKEMPDLAVLITQVLLASKTLFGSNPDQLLSQVPYKDFMLAMADSLDNLMTEVKCDTRNVLLTLARIWNTVETDTICSKSDAAKWAIDRMPSEYKPVLQRAIAICIGETIEYWDDIETLVQPCADFMFGQINTQISSSKQSNNIRKSIRLGEY